MYLAQPINFLRKKTFFIHYIFLTVPRMKLSCRLDRHIYYLLFFNSFEVALKFKLSLQANLIFLQVFYKTKNIKFVFS